MGQADIREQITSFKDEFDALPDVSEPPRTTLDVLREQTREKYWNRLLRYFLTPDAPHGFGTTLLERFLEIIEDETDSAGLTAADHRLVQVESEVMSDQGRPDLLLYIPDEWFVCIELKVTAPETGEQTAEYAASRRLGNLDVSNYAQEDRAFVYLAKEDNASPASDRFAHVCWKKIEAILGELLTHDRGQYPARSTAQLADFRDTIRDLTMSNSPYDTQQAEYVELYLENQGAIDAVRDAFEDLVERQCKTWATEFQDHYRPNEWSDAWHCDQGKYGKIYHEDWRRDATGDRIEDWSDASFRLEFRHRIRDERSWKDGTVTFRTVIPRNSDDDYRERFHEIFTERADDLAAPVESTQIAVLGNSRTVTEATYSFEPADGPAGYYHTLTKAFDEHSVLVKLLHDIFKQVYLDCIEE